MPTVAVKPELIRWAIARSGLSVDELVKKFPKLEEWGATRQPTIRQLENFAKTTMTPLGFLFLDEPPIVVSIRKSFEGSYFVTRTPR